VGVTVAVGVEVDEQAPTPDGLVVQTAWLAAGATTLRGCADKSVATIRTRAKRQMKDSSRRKVITF
jgi:hypothetical protein